MPLPPMSMVISETISTPMRPAKSRPPILAKKLGKARLAMTMMPVMSSVSTKAYITMSVLMPPTMATMQAISRPSGMTTML